MIWRDTTPKCSPWRWACIQYLTCKGDAERCVGISPSRFNAPPSRLSDSHTKRKIPGHLDEKWRVMAIITKLRPKSVPISSEDLFWGSTPDFRRKLAKFRTNFGEDLCVCSSPGLLPHYDCVKRPSMQHFTSLNAACTQHQTKSNSNFEF